MHPRHLCTAASVLVALALPGSSTALAPPSPACPNWATYCGPTYTLGFTDASYDSDGNVIATATQDGLPVDQPFGDAETSGSDLPTETDVGDPVGPGEALTPDQTFSAQATLTADPDDPCRKVDYTITKHTFLFGAVAWRYHQTNYFCWTYPHITKLVVDSFFSDTDSQEVINWEDHGSGYYYAWRGAANGAHYTRRQGSISNCVLRYGCISTYNPIIDVWINGNGAALAKVSAP